MSSDEEMNRCSTDGERSAVDALNVEQFQEQATEPCTSKKTVGSINADLQGAHPTAADVQKLQEELTDINEQLKTCLDRLQSVTDQPGTISDARRLKEQLYQSFSDLCQQSKRSIRILRKVWGLDIQDDSISFSDVTQRVTNVPHEYRLDIQDASNSSGDVTHNQVEVVLVNKASAPTDSASATGGQEVHRVKVTPQSTTFNLNSGPVRVNTITDDAIQQADKNVLITKIDWAEELARVQQLKREQQRLVRQLKREKARGQQQQEARERAEKQLADLYRRHKEEKEREQQRAKNFYMGIVRGKNQHLKGLMQKIEASDCLRDVIQHLFEDFNVRLLGIDSGLRFLMDVPSEEYEDVLRQQDHIKNLLEQKVFPDQKAEWTQVTSCDLPSEESDLQLGQPLPVRIQSQVFADVTRAEVPSASGGASFDPMTTTPRRVFVSDMAADGGTSGGRSYITAIIATGNGQIVMVDGKNKTVKVADMTNQDTVSDITLDDEPLTLTLLHDGQVVVTSFTRKLHLVDVSGPPSVVSRVQTARRYWGVSAGTTDDTLIVSCRTEGHELARVDVITYNGDVIRTVIDSNTLKELGSPDYLSVVDGDVIVSDYSTNTVYRVELATGRVVARFIHPDMKKPRQVCADPSGNIYIACSDSKCVLVMSADGQWRRLLEGSQHGDKGCVRPWGMYVTGSYIVVSWRGAVDHSVVAVYQL